MPKILSEHVAQAAAFVSANFMEYGSYGTFSVNSTACNRPLWYHSILSLVGLRVYKWDIIPCILQQCWQLELSRDMNQNDLKPSNCVGASWLNQGSRQAQLVWA
jgi:hypothetical protein